MKNTTAILKILYPIVEKKMNSRAAKFKQCISKFVDRRNQQLFDTGPYDRMPYGSIDADELHEAVDIDRVQVKNAISETYYWNIAAFNPSTLVCLAMFSMKDRTSSVFVEFFLVSSINFSIPAFVSLIS